MAVVGTGVTIGSRTIRVIQVRKQKTGTWEVTKALIAPVNAVDPSDQQLLGEARAALQSAQAKGRTLLGVTGRDLIVRYTQVPPVPDWRLEMLMNFEIQEVSEQSGGDVSAAYALLDVDDTTSGDNVVLVALAKNGYLKPRLAALKSAGLDCLGGSPRAIAAFKSYQENGRLRHDETVVIVHIGHENTDVAIARHGSLLFARNVSGGSGKFTDQLMQSMRVNFPTAEKLKINKGNLTPRGKAKYRDSGEEKIANTLMTVGGHFVSAVNSSVMFAKAQTKVPDCAPDRVVLMGGGALLRGLPEYLESNLGLPVELFDPLSEVDLAPLAPEAAKMLEHDQGAVAVTLGLAQLAAEEQGVHVAILPEEDRKKRQFVEHTLFSIVSSVVLAVALVVVFVLAGGAHDKASAEMKTLSDKKEAYLENKKAYDKARKRVELVNDQKYKMRLLVTNGPAIEIMLDLVQEALTSSGEEPFDEVFVSKVSSRMTDYEVPDPRTGTSTVYRIPEVEFECAIQQIGARSVSEAFSGFMSTVRRMTQAKGYLEFNEKGGLPPGAKTFKFNIRQTDFPERPRAEASDEPKDES